MAGIQRELPLRSEGRDLADPRLWSASHHRSLERRRVAASRRPGVPAAPVALVAAAGAIAAPAAALASPAAAETGLTAVQRALGVTADGQMGPETRAAIRRFQRRHHLPVVGIAGPRTRAALGLDGSKASVSPKAATGTSVIAVQRHLGVDADGVVGPQTRAAIRDFQSAHGLSVTGHLDGDTRSQILQSDAPAGDDAASSDGATAPASSEPAQGTGVAAAVAAARAQIGKPYRSAGKGPGGFDCSGLTAYAFRAAGVSLGSSSYAQYGQGTPVSRSQIQPGDLVFFNTNGGGASHVGIATSATTMISATSHGVMENSFTSGYWGAHYVGARRVG
jgi:peptidoglycan DL-endopeptidase CwlO